MVKKGGRTKPVGKVEKKEKSWEALWKRFHETIAIEGRLNPRRQMGHCPTSYWGYMTEFGAAEAASFF